VVSGVHASFQIKINMLALAQLWLGFLFWLGGDLMRYYKDWGVCSREEHDLLAKIYHDQRSNRTKKAKPVDYSIKPPVLKARHSHR
jgi:hypothetical protein